MKTFSNFSVILRAHFQSHAMYVENYFLWKFLENILNNIIKLSLVIYIKKTSSYVAFSIKSLKIENRLVPPPLNKLKLYTELITILPKFLSKRLAICLNRENFQSCDLCMTPRWPRTDPSFVIDQRHVKLKLYTELITI